MAMMHTRSKTKYSRVIISSDDTNMAQDWCTEYFGEESPDMPARWFYSWGGFYFSIEEDLILFVLRWKGVIAYNVFDAFENND